MFGKKLNLSKEISCIRFMISLIPLKVQCESKELPQKRIDSFIMGMGGTFFIQTV